MKPLSSRTRRLYLIVLALLFCIVVPCALLYAAGWRYKSGFGFVETGGIFVNASLSDATIYLNDAQVGETNFLYHSVYVNDLAASAYVVRVEKEGYRSWNKVLVVEPQLVTDAQAVFIPTTITPIKLIVGTTATGTREISQAQLADLQEAFLLSDASSTTLFQRRGSMAIALADGDVDVEWTQAGTRPTSIFCGRPSYCVTDIPLQHTGKVTSAAFYDGGVAYTTKEGGVFFSEVDIRPTLSTVALFPHAGADFRIVNGDLVIQYKKDFYQIDGF